MLLPNPTKNSQLACQKPRRKKGKKTARRFDQRSDVVLKTILRACRKICLDQFSAEDDRLMTPARAKKASSSSKGELELLQAVKKFVTTHLPTLPQDSAENGTVQHVAAFLNPRKSVAKTENPDLKTYRNLSFQVFNLLYKFNKSRLDQALEN